MNIILKFIKFSLVGFLGMVVDFSITWLLKEKCRLNKYLANSVGFVCAATNNYIFNRIWTFESHQKNIPLEFLSFVVVALIGLLLNNLILYLLTEKKIISNFYLAKLIAIAVIVIWNFVANYLFTFRSFPL